MKKQFLIIFSILILSSQVYATPLAESDEFIEDLLKKMDKNKDRIITRDEVIEFSKEDFKRMTGGLDGYITKEKFKEYVCTNSCKTYSECDCTNPETDTQYVEDYFDRIDLDGDGKITLNEKIADDLESFKGLDRNADGIFDATDFSISFE